MTVEFPEIVDEQGIGLSVGLTCYRGQQGLAVSPLCPSPRDV